MFNFFRWFNYTQQIWCLKELFSQVLSSRIMPCHPSTTMVSVRFGEDILKEGGLRHLLNVLDKEALPFDVDTDTRQEILSLSCCSIHIKILEFLNFSVIWGLSRYCNGQYIGINFQCWCSKLPFCRLQLMIKTLGHS